MTKGEQLINEFEQAIGTNINLFLKYKNKYKEYKLRAKKSGLIFTLTFQQFYLAVTSKCYICGLDGKTNEIGIDRLNNKKGYTYYNIGGCCWTCNRMKSNMSLIELKEYIKRVNPNHRLLK